MPNGIRLGVAADTREFDRGIKQGVIDPLEDATDALRDLAKDGDRAGSDLERSMRDQQDETKKLEREYRDLADTIKSSSRKAGRDIDDGIGDGLDKAGTGLNDFKDEAKSTAREGAASFSGEFSDVGDVVQETLANALGGFGPIGAAAGVAAAVGFGFLTAKIDADAAASEERIASMYDAMIESQGKFLTDAAVMDQVKALTDDAGALAEAQEVAAGSGVDLGIVLRAMAGDADAAAEVQAALNDQYDKAVENADKAAKEARDLTDAELKQSQATGKAADIMSKYSDDMSKAAEKYAAYSSAARYATNQMQDAAATAAGLRKEIVRLPDGKTITLRVDDNISSLSSRFNTALSAMRRQASSGVQVDYQLTKNGKKVY